MPISFSDPELEPLVFPDLFPDGNGYFNQGISNPETRAETYRKYIKERLLGYDPWFRLHPTWPVWSYLQLEKLQNF